jgi:hypothetical protein
VILQGGKSIFATFSASSRATKHGIVSGKKHPKVQLGMETRYRGTRYEPDDLTREENPFGGYRRHRRL